MLVGGLGYHRESCCSNFECQVLAQCTLWGVKVSLLVAMWFELGGSSWGLAELTGTGSGG
jgi:hypothetical protein